MRTNPLLAKREIPVKERLQKALIVLVVTALIVAAIWVISDVSLHKDRGYLFAIGLLTLSGLLLASFFWFKKDEAAKTKEESRFLRHRIDDDRQGRGWTSRIVFNTRRILAGIIVFIGGLFVLAGLAVLGLQIFAYLKLGDWKPVPVLELVSPHIPWLRNPQSWFGLHNIISDALDFVPVSLLLFLAGWLIAGFGSALRERVRR